MTTSSPASSETSNLQIERVRHPFAARHMQLMSREIVSPGFVRITLGGADLANFNSAGFDDHVKLLLPAVGQEKPLLPSFVDGRPNFGEGERPTARDFTPVRWDHGKGTMVLEFAMHEAGPAAQWAANAQIGQWVGIAGPRGSMVVPKAFEWHWLFGDASALPAIERRLSELPAEVRVTVRVQLEHAADKRVLESAAQVDLQWVDSLDAAAQALAIPEGDGFIWAAGEHSDMAQLRRTFLAKPGVNAKRMRVAAYWKRGEVAHHAELNEG